MTRSRRPIHVPIVVWAILGATAPAAARLPYGAQGVDQSAYALGSVSLNVVFVESNGLIDPSTEDWTAEQLAQVHDQIDLAVDFWEQQTDAYHPNARLRFTVDYINGGVPLETSYEPITRPGNLGAVSVWMNEVLGQVYFEGNPIGDASSLNEVARFDHDTNWATTLFVVNDEADEDNRFSNGKFAFAVVGGPYIVTTFGNDGWGIENYHRVLAHEMGHTFFALDEYEESLVRNTARSGYLNGVNGNAERDGQGNIIVPPQPNSLMLDTSLALSDFSRVQVGLVDADGDAVPDILDTPPLLTDAATSHDADAGWFRLLATAEVTALPNLNRYNLDLSSSGSPMTINWITGAEYQIDDGPWLGASAADGAFDDYLESIDVLLEHIPRGRHELRFRAVNSVDNRSEPLTYEFVSNVPEPSALLLCLLTAACLARTGSSRKFDCWW